MPKNGDKMTEAHTRKRAHIAAQCVIIERAQAEVERAQTWLDT